MVYVLFAEGFEEIEALAPIDILLRGGVAVKKLSIGDSCTVTGAHGIRVETDGTLKAALDTEETPDAVFLPGGMPGAKNLDASPLVTEILHRTEKKGGILAAICAAPMVLGTRDYLENKEAVCYPGFEKFLRGARLSARPVVTDGNITTAVGMGAASALGLRLLSLLKDEETARRIADMAFITMDLEA